MEMLLKILVPIFTIITLVSKWHRSSYCDKHRWRGFAMQAIQGVFWIFYFVVTKQPWVALLTMSSMYFAVRGLRNNRGGKV